MNMLHAAGCSALPWMLATALLAWALCTARRNVGLVDIFWSLFLLVATLCFLRDAGAPTSRALLVLSLVGIWALRLAAHLAVRNWNAPEDHRYQAIRARNQPGFAWKSLYLVFGLQAVLAFVVSLPLHAAINSSRATEPAGCGRRHARHRGPAGRDHRRYAAGGVPR